MGDLPQGTVYWKLIKPLALYPIQEIEDRYCCIFCGQDYFSDNVNKGIPREFFKSKILLGFNVERDSAKEVFKEVIEDEM